MKIYTATIWQKDEMDPCTVAFDAEEKAQAYKEQMEKIFADGGDTYYRVTLDSCTLNDGREYMNAFASEMDVDLPAEPETEVEEGEELTVSYAVEGRYYATVILPKGTRFPDENSSCEEQREFVKAIKREASIHDYYKADFGELSDIDGHAISIEDVNGNILWEEGSDVLCSRG